MELSRIFICTLLVALSSPSMATLIGDTVDAGIYLNDNRLTSFGLDNPFEVEAGNADQKQYSIQFLIDFEAEGFSVDYINTSSWTPGIELRTFDLDWVGVPSGELTGLTIDTNIAGWNDSLASFTNDSATFAWGGLAFNTNSFFNVSFQTDHAPAVPEPTGLALIGLGLLGLYRRSRT